MNFRLVNNLVNSNFCKEIKEPSRYIHYSAIYKGNKIIFNGCNNNRNVFNGKCICFSTHAEMDVIAKLLKVAARTTI
jgi:hypothetical protein